jgi:hypothetical protein
MSTGSSSSSGEHEIDVGQTVVISFVVVAVVRAVAAGVTGGPFVST